MTEPRTPLPAAAPAGRPAARPEAHADDRSTDHAAPDTVFVHGVLFDGSPATASSVPGAVAVRDGRIVAVGSDDDVLALAGPSTTVVDLAGRLLVPGFQDTHVHPILAASMARRLNVTGERTLAGTLAAIGAYAAAHPDEPWITGWGWNADLFDGGLPTREQLDALVADRPALIHRGDGHASWANSLAIAAAGLDDDGTGRPVADPPGGRVERDADGRARGVLHEWATGLVERLVPEASADERLRDLVAGQTELLSVGITAWQDASVRPPEQEAYERAQASGELRATVVGALRWEHERGMEQVAELVARRDARTGAAGGTFRPTSVKLMLDGVVDGSLTAAMLDPYLDADGTESTNRGDTYLETDHLDAVVEALCVAGFQPHFHVIGDRAVRQALDALERTLGRHPELADAEGRLAVRPVLSHVQVVHPDDRARFGRLGVVVSAQPLWASCEDVQTELTIPFLGDERTAWQYPFASLRDAGAVLAGGSDWPVSTPDPIQAIHVAVNRSLHGEDRPPLGADEAITLAQGLAAYTSGAAWANGLEGSHGRLAPGYAADLAVVDRDLFALAPEEIGAARVVQTWLRGALVFERD